MHANAYGIECIQMCANARQCTAMQQKRNADVIECIGMCLNEVECTHYGMYRMHFYAMLMFFVKCIKMQAKCKKFNRAQITRIPGTNHT